MKLLPRAPSSLEAANRKVDFMSEYHCKICDKRFKKFSIFEGHFAFNAKCRSTNCLFMQCFVCREEFSHFTSLKYHLQRHSLSNVCKRIPWESIEVKSAEAYHFGNQSQNERLVWHSNGQVKRSHQINGNKAVTEISINTNKVAGDISIKQVIISDQLNGNKISEISKVNKSRKKLGRQCPVCKLYICGLKKFGRIKFIYFLNETLTTFPSHLGIHMRVHTDGTFKCDICNIRFTKNSLVSHNTRFHPDLVTSKRLLHAYSDSG